MSDGEGYDDFPAGLRVLAVDDNPTCLKLLETLLRKCQYHGLFFVFYFLYSILILVNILYLI